MATTENQSVISHHHGLFCPKSSEVVIPKANTFQVKDLKDMTDFVRGYGSTLPFPSLPEKILPLYVSMLSLPEKILTLYVYILST